MKREISPGAAVALVIVVLLVIGGVVWWRLQPPATANAPTMPPDVAAEFQRRMGTQGPPTGPTAAQPR